MSIFKQAILIWCLVLSAKLSAEKVPSIPWWAPCIPLVHVVFENTLPGKPLKKLRGLVQNKSSSAGVIIGIILEWP